MKPGELLDWVMSIEAPLASQVRLYKLRPRATPELPALYHLIPSPDTLARRDTGTQIDTVRITTRLAVAFNDPDQEADQLLALTDSYLDLIDPALWNDDLPSGMVNAKRTGWSQAVDEFNGTPVLCMDFPLELQLSRPIR